jgi:hypothetical protein
MVGDRIATSWKKATGLAPPDFDKATMSVSALGLTSPPLSRDSVVPTFASVQFGKSPASSPVPGKTSVP